MAFCFMEIDSIIIKFEQIYADLSLVFGGHLGNMQIKRLPLGEM